MDPYRTGGIFLLIHRMSATFGKLQNHTLELKEGLNIIQAPNETGKSTWCAFLTAMLYGINSRERDRAGFIAEKNRFAPWSGAPMSGRLECTQGGQDLTLVRTTRRQTAPLGDFQATYTGTGNPVPDLTAQNCGEKLLGVTREVFERSAFIRQNGMAVSQDAGLERRIAALISSGEEDTSYSEAADALKKQLNRRRHNRTGQIPALEAALQETQQQIAEAAALEQQLSSLQAQVRELSSQEDALLAELALQDAWDAQQAARALSDAGQEARLAQQAADQLRCRLEQERIPENEAIGRLRGAIVNLQTVRRASEKARAQRDEAMKALLRAEADLGESPFAGQSPESAQKEVRQTALPDRLPGSIVFRVLSIFLLFLAGAAGLFALLYSKTGVLDLSSPLRWLISGGAAAVVAGAGAFLSRLYRRRALETLRTTALTKRFGTADTDEIQRMADSYCKLCQVRDAAQADANAKSASADALYTSLTSNEQGILLEVRRFAPSAYDIPTADQLLRQCAMRRRELAEAETAARDAQLRFQLQQERSPEAPEAAPVSAPPERDRTQVTAQLERVRTSLSDARSAADQLTGRLEAMGDPVALRSSEALLRRQLADLEGEYDAIRMAMDALDEANTTLQNRFSPALGRRAAQIFARLTDQRYSGVVLDRSFHLSAEPAGDTAYRDAALLSAGAADQLYLAVRLAICELVLPGEDPAPLVLDDALANFDDRRCAAALQWLKEEARHRQILLFTCHSREAEFFAGDGEVSIQRLTQTQQKV